MPRHIQIREVPAAVHRELARQAEASGLSLNRFMLGECERIARRGRNVEVLRRAAERAGPRLSAEQIVATIRADRDRGE